MKAYKGRKIDPRFPVEVYRNLHHPGVVYSIRQRGLVVAHADRFCLSECHFHVSPSGREKVIREKKKYVHAWVLGYMAGQRGISVGDRVSYNPFTHTSFMCNNAPITSASRARFTPKGVFV